MLYPCYKNLLINLFILSRLGASGDYFIFAASFEQGSAASIGVLASSFNRVDLHEMAAEIGVFTFNFNEQSMIDEGAKLIRNIWVYQHHKWTKMAQAPLPTVFYDFGFYSKKNKDKKLLGHQLREKILALGSRPINPPEAMKLVRNKLKFSALMDEFQLMHPETIKYSDSSLSKFVDQHSFVFLKPVRGSKGDGIVEIRKDAGTYVISYQIKKLNVWHERRIHCPEDSLVKNVHLAFEELKQDDKEYLVQKGVPVLLFNRMRTDFRVSTHRTGTGEAEVVALIVRLGGNISQAGQIASAEEVLANFEEQLGFSSEDLERKIDTLALLVFRAIEEKAGLPIGELGLDFVISEQGEVYIIEANDKPGYRTPKIGRFINENAYRQSAMGAARRNLSLIEYARYLSLGSSPRNRKLND